MSEWPENQGEIQNVENYCEVCRTLNNDPVPCNFPYCTEDLACEKEPVIETPTETDNNISVDDGLSKESPVVEFFKYQKRLNDLEKEKSELEKNKNEVFQKVKTDIQTIFIALDCEELNTKIELTKTGLRISYPLHVVNDYQTRLLDTDLFTQLNKLIGMTGKLNMVNSEKQAGNYVYVLEIDYDLKI